jgi:hypothetical protein
MYKTLLWIAKVVQYIAQKSSVYTHAHIHSHCARIYFENINLGLPYVFFGIVLQMQSHAFVS